MIKTIGVIGCGWLGFSLATDLLKSGYTVKGTTTSTHKLEKLLTAGIKGYVVKLNENKIDGDIKNFLSNIDTLIVNIPPGLRKNKTVNYVAKVELLLQEIEKAKIKKVLFISSTSVYGAVEGEITEETPPKPKTESGKQLLKCERLFLDQKSINTSIIRFGGLIGPDRHPVYMLSGKNDLKNGEELVNLIHIDDCIYMIKTILKNEYWGILFNGVYPLHPTKKEYYTQEAAKRSLAKPIFLPSLAPVSKKTILNKGFLNKKHFLYTSIIS